MLGERTALTRLGLSSNDMGLKGAGTLAEVLLKCTALRRLDLGCSCRISNAALRSLGVLGDGNVRV